MYTCAISKARRQCKINQFLKQHTSIKKKLKSGHLVVSLQTNDFISCAQRKVKRYPERPKSTMPLKLPSMEWKK